MPVKRDHTNEGARSATITEAVEHVHNAQSELRAAVSCNRAEQSAAAEFATGELKAALRILKGV